ncbi:penicillin-binding protein activator, partial [Salmonella enterica subsp. enterica serovar Poona]
LLLPLIGLALRYGRPFLHVFDAANNLFTHAGDRQPAAAPDAPVEPGVAEPHPQMTHGVASPSQASVRALPDAARSQSAPPGRAPP